MEKKANEIKTRGLKKLKLGGGEKMQKAASELGDGYHADMPGSTPESDKKMYRYQESADRLAGTGIDLDPDTTTPTKMYDSPAKFVSPGMTPEATGSGFKMSMGSKENFSDSNFSSKDQSTMSQAPSIMKNNYGGESVEMKDQGSPLNYGMRGQTKVERKMTRAENEQAGADKKAEQKRQYLKDAMAVAQTAANVAGSFIKPG